MTESLPVAEIPKTAEDRRHLAHRAGSYVVETVKDAFAKESTRRVAGSLAILGAALTAAEFGHWFNHDGAALEFLQGSGRHFFVGYFGAMVGIASSKAETIRGKIAAGLIGGMAGDFAAEAVQATFVTGIVHQGPQNIIGFLKPDQVMWGNAKDAGAAELAAMGAAIQAIAARPGSD